MLEITKFHKLRNSRVKVFYAVAAAMFIYLSCGLFLRQVVQNKLFNQKQNHQSLRRVVIPGTRGNIYDRNGILLAGYKKSFSINLYLNELRAAFRNEYCRRANICRENEVIFNAVDLRQKVKEDIVKQYLDVVNDAIQSNYYISGKDIEKHSAQKFLLPMKIASGISQKEYEKLVYVLPKDFPVQLSIDEHRYYPYNELACHVLGYVVMDECKRDIADLDDKVRTFIEKRQAGKTGVELVKDDVLKGDPGFELWQVDPAGGQRELLKSESPKHGSSVILSLDKKLQVVAEEALGYNRGCVIVMNIKSGEILAMASKPSYDINLLVPKISHEVYEKITSELGWLNLATQGKFPLGSVFKLVSSIAFLKSGEVLSTDSVFCSGVTKIGDRKFRCKNHPWDMDITFGEAIARSCNTFFYENSKKVRKERIIREAMDLGLSEKTGIELPYEASGFVPTEAWKKKRGFGSWVIGDTVNLSIGQGYLLVTPIEVCCMTASIAANRLRTKPTIFLNGNIGVVAADTTLGLSKDDYGFLIDSMVEVVENRSGRRAKVDNLKIAGKTGTAQFFENGEKRNLAWFTCFAPVDDPEIAVTVMVQERNKYDSYWGGINSAPIAKEILSSYFSEK